MHVGRSTQATLFFNYIVASDKMVLRFFIVDWKHTKKSLNMGEGLPLYSIRSFYYVSLSGISYDFLP